MGDQENTIEVDLARSRELQRKLAEELVAKGAIRSPEWRAIFERTPRHPFIPRFYRRVENDHRTPYLFLDGARPDLRDGWLGAVYADETLVTQLDGYIATSSSTIPSTMARMLETLDLKDGQRVLEIGTGTGYNAALLCERLGSERVTTIDIDP
ncbi:MAG: 3-oxoacyl-[acyl-carrier-protein] synthase III C-terminal domain-containing protein, partial [Actinomycetota bacterium]